MKFGAFSFLKLRGEAQRSWESRLLLHLRRFCFVCVIKELFDFTCLVVCVCNDLRIALNIGFALRNF